MKRLKTYGKQFLSALTALAVGAVFSLAVYGAPAPGEMPEAEADQDGILMANGNVTVNGNAAKTGMTVVSGSTVVTGTDSIAMVESPVFGRVTLGPGTTAKIVYSDAKLRIESTCDDMRVACKEGQCTVTGRNGVAKVLNAGDDEHFDRAVDVTSDAYVDVVVNCGSDVVCPPPIVAVVSSNFLLPILLLGGVATGVTIGVISGGGHTTKRTPVSGVQP